MGQRLDSWKDIAAYLGREVRTVQRWAVSRALPIHRLPGGNRPRVFSTKSEIDAWLRVSADATRADRREGVSIAVLPFLSLAGGADAQYFGDGLAEDVINALVRIPGLRVTARTSSFALSGRQQDVRDIGARLGVDWLLEGSVRRERTRVRVSAQLVGSRDGFHAWSECYDRELTDLFGIQDDIATAIARSLKLKLTHEPPAKRPPGDLAAYDLWVKGRSISQEYTPAALAQARDCYEAAIARDPEFALAHFGLAELLFQGAMFGLAAPRDAVPRARAAITRSLELDDQLGEAHALLGACRGILDYDWPGAEAAFQRAFERSPGSAAILAQHAWYYLTPRLRIAEAVDQAHAAVALDPLSPRTRGSLGLVLMAARQYARAVEECAAAVSLAPGLWWLRWFYGGALLADGKPVQGLRHCRRVYEELHHPLAAGGMALIYGLALRKGQAQQLLADLQDMSRTADVPPLALAWAYIGVGDDRAFEWLDKAVDARDLAVILLPSMPMYDAVRDDPRFRAILAKMNLT